MSEPTKGHPKGLYVLFVTEMWERFSYYGMRAIFVLFLTKALLFDKALGSDIYGSYTGLVYLTPLIGGYMADRYWGNRKSIIVGGIMMAIGQFFMFLSGSFYENAGLAPILMMAGLTMLILGNGFFKPNISTMVGQLYPKGDSRVDSAFTIFYMGINLGAFFSPLVCGVLGDTGDPADFKWGFLAACCGMIISTAIFVWLKDHYIVTPEGQPIGAKPNKQRETADIDTTKEVKSEFTKAQIFTWLGIEVVLYALFFFLGQGVIGSFIFSLSIAAPGFIISDKSLTKIEKQRIWVIYIVAFFVIFFWAAFEQAGASLTFFAEEQTQREVGWHLSKGVMIFLYGLVAVILGYYAYKVITGMKNEKKGVRELLAFLLLAGIGTMIWLISTLNADGVFIDTIPTSFFQSINAVAIVIFAPLFSLMWIGLGKRRMEPASPYKQSIGLFLLAVGYFVISFGVKGIDASTKVSMMWLFSLYLIHTFGELCLSPIGLSMVNKLAPVKFASLLMGVWFLSTAAANKFAGTLSSYYPETMIAVSAVEEQKVKNGYELSKLDKTEEINGVQYVSIDAVNFGKVTERADSMMKASDKMPDGPEKVAKQAEAKNALAEARAKKPEIVNQVFAGSFVKEKSFVGYKINDLYSFFMLFVFMAGIASVILFFLSKMLLKMMHGVR
jgi:proton-dependent oligopeptide transporter, POT family